MIVLVFHLEQSWKCHQSYFEFFKWELR